MAIDATHVLAFAAGAVLTFTALAAWACVKVGADSEKRGGDDR